ncbi:hypothetical protein BLD25_01045 [Candidatus Gracilibacteria bacterium GN02-872]|nr:hypothetical protein BLD25_01045 [Candidatus Gracilibacteria bacterium GN02-872]
MTLTVLDALYIVLIVFSSVIGTLLIITLIRIIKILGPIVEIAEFYEKVKQTIIAYSQIPTVVKEKFKGKKQKTEKKSKETKEGEK